MSNRSDPSPAPTRASRENTSPPIREILFSRGRTILAVFVLSLLAGIFFASRPRKYVADGTIRVEPNSASMYRTSPMSLLSGNGAEEITSETTILQSRTLYLRVAKDLDLANNATFWDKKLVRNQSLDDPLIREKLVTLMRTKIQVTHSSKDEIIRITCTTTSPALSAKIVNTLINEYVEYLFQMRFGATQRASGWLVGQLDDLKKQIESDQNNITALQSKLGLIGLDEKGTDTLSTEALRGISKAASDATVERIVAEAKLRFLQDSDPNLIEGEINLLGGTGNATSSLLQSLRSSQAQASSNYARLSAQFGENYPEVKEQKAQLDEISQQLKAEQQRILNQARMSFSAASANERMTTQELSQKKGEASSSHDDMVRYAILSHDYQSHRGLYEGLVQRLREAGITSGLEAGGIDIVDLADLPAVPLPPGPVSIILICLGVGLVVGCLSAFGLELVDHRIVQVVQAERATNMSLLALLPNNAPRGKRSQEPAEISPIATIAHPHSRYAEALQSLRTAILLANPGSIPKVVLLTSAMPGDGKSMTSINLAATFAQHGARVLIIDCDLRRGMIHTRVGAKPSPGLTNVLAGNLSLQEAVQQIEGSPDLYVLTGGPRSPRPAVLMASSLMDLVIEEARKTYDIVILDTPPVIGMADTVNLAHLADAVVLVVRQKHSSREAVISASRTLSAPHIPAIGFVLNDFDSGGLGYGYGYGYYYNDYYKDGKEGRA